MIGIQKGTSILTTTHIDPTHNASQKPEPVANLGVELFARSLIGSCHLALKASGWVQAPLPRLKKSSF